MTATYNRAENERLEREAREDDKRMTPGEWEVRDLGLFSANPGSSRHYETASVTSLPDYGRNLPAIARTRNNLRAMADQLEAARTRIADADTEISAANSEISSLRVLRAATQGEVERLAEANRSLTAAIATARTEGRNEAARDMIRVCGERDDYRRQLDEVQIKLEAARVEIERLHKLAADVRADEIHDFCVD